MNIDALLEHIASRQRGQRQIYHVEELPERPARYAAVELKPALAAALRRRGIERLYTHQAEAIRHVRDGKSVVVVTSTASGKTLCYWVPIVETLLDNPLATALTIYPTKALAQDQFRGLTAMRDDLADTHFLCGPYDGDTPQNQRRKLRNQASVILTNPDMLHQGILPNHARWARFFQHLKFVVIDEVHAYRGVFGSHLANVVRRLHRVCRHFGAEPQFICSSATIANPREHAERLTRRPMEIVTNDGSPRGGKKFVLWNPPLLQREQARQTDAWQTGGERRSALWTAVELLTELVKNNVQTIAFVQTRLMAELLASYARQYLSAVSKRLADRVQAYRGGYLPEERREIERRLASGDILGVASTNALELGIDIGSLDACILVGYPGTIASLWQRAGRAGRGSEDSVVFLVAQNSPIDQYLMYHSRYLFEQNPERAITDPDNPHIAVGHVKCALHELPMPDDEAETFGEYAEPILELLEEQQTVRHIEGKWYWASTEYPAAEVNLRNLCGPVYTIQDTTDGDRVIGTLDEVSALAQLHDHAVYIHSGEIYFVDKLDLEKKIAFVTRRDLDYFTQSVQSSRIRLDEAEEERAWRECTVGFGDVTVTTHIPMFRKMKFHARDSLGFEKLDLPPQELETVALWLVPPDRVRQVVQSHGLVLGDGLTGIANAMVEVAPMFVMCDVQDIGVVVDNANLGRDAIFLYDRYPGGMGYAERCAEVIGELIESIHTVIGQCGCQDGCPSCVGAAVPSFAQTDLDSAVRGRIPDKDAALVVLHELLGLPPHQPGARPRAAAPGQGRPPRPQPAE